jgi:molybdenum cofactor cytidylyltransferase
MGLGGVILAAGESNRMGRDKALLPWPPAIAVANSTARTSGTLLSRAIEGFNKHCDFVVVVAGKNAATLRSVVDGLGAILVVNPAPERGQFSSLQTGLREVINRGWDSAMITLVDRPAPGGATFEHLLTSFATRAHETWAVVPEFEGRHGHPILIAREMIEAFLKAPAAANARDIEHSSQKHIAYVPVDDRRAVMNINTPEDYASLRSSSL